MCPWLLSKRVSGSQGGKTETVCRCCIFTCKVFDCNRSYVRTLNLTASVSTCVFFFLLLLFIYFSNKHDCENMIYYSVKIMT